MLTCSCGTSTCGSIFKFVTPGTSAITARISSPLAQHGQVGPEGAHDDRGAGAREDFLDALLEVREHVPVEAGIAVDQVLDFRDGLRQIDVRLDADPQLGEVGAHDFVGHFGAADVRAEIAHAGNARAILGWPGS